MEDLYHCSNSLARIIWSLATANLDQEVFLTITNSIGDEILIKGFWDWNGIHCNLQFFSDGVLLTEKTMEGGSYEALEVFLIEALDIEKHRGHKNDIFSDDSASHSSNSIIMTFSQFVEDIEIDNILATDPEIALHEKKVLKI